MIQRVNLEIKLKSHQIISCSISRSSVFEFWVELKKAEVFEYLS